MAEAGAGSLAELSVAVVRCRRCPRLVTWREQTGRKKRAAYRDEDYWAKPVPGFGDPRARLVVVGLAPGAHGANRTGRMFTGDRSGGFLYRALYRSGFANQPRSESRDDGLELRDAWITAPVRCAPPGNKPTPDERDRCSVWFHAELDLLRQARVYVALGAYAYQSLWGYLRTRGAPLPTPRPGFAHGEAIELGEERTLLLSYHPSQQNTFTGRLTEDMFDAVFTSAARLLR